MLEGYLRLFLMKWYRNLKRLDRDTPMKRMAISWSTMEREPLRLVTMILTIIMMVRKQL